MPNLIKIEAADATELASILLDLTSNQFKEVFYMHCDHEQPTLMKRVIGSSMLYQDALDTTSFFVMTDNPEIMFLQADVYSRELDLNEYSFYHN